MARRIADIERDIYKAGLAQTKALTKSRRAEKGSRQQKEADKGLTRATARLRKLDDELADARKQEK